jgi:hypothetical protein
MKKVFYSMMFAGITGLVFGTLASVGCGSEDKVGAGGGGGGIGGNVVVKLDGSTGPQGGNSGTSGSTPTGDANCGAVTSNTQHMPADVLLVLDRSGSMSESISEACYCDPSKAGSGTPACADTTGCTTRWSAVTTALTSTLSATADIRWGLKLYSSSGSGCTVNNGVEVTISATGAAGIQSRIASTSPGGNTPTAQAIAAATAYLKTVTDANNKVILLATDGEPNCASGGSSTPNVPATLDAITAAKTAGYPVYVIGIGPSVGNLDNFAQAGGTDKYFPATSAADLTSALTAISTAVTTCTFNSPTPPPDPNNVAVYLDKKLVAKDPANGWSFGASTQTIVLNGSSCDLVTSGKATSVEILFGCPGIDPPKIIP